MGRSRSFEETVVVRAAGDAFLSTGYEGTSIEELVVATGLHRGSLYQAFASKRGLFVSCLRAAVTERPQDAATTDLLLVALLELAPRDAEVRELVRDSLTAAGGTPASLGARLLERAGLHLSQESR